MTETVNLSRESIEILANQLARQTGGPRMPAYSTSGASNMFTEIGNNFAKSTNTIADVLGKISTGTANHSDVLKATTYVLEKFGGTVGNVAGHALSTLGEQIFAVNDTMKLTGEYGVTIGGNLGDFNQSVMRAHLTLTEFADIIATNAQEIVGMGGGMDASARRFTKLLDDISVTDAARHFKAAGMTALELANITQVATMNQRGYLANAKDEDRARKDATSSVILLAQEVDIATQITGKRRSQEAAELKKEQQAVDTQVLIALKSAQNPEYAANLAKATAGMSESAKRLVAVYAGGGPRDKADIDLVATYGPEASARMAQLAKSLDTNDQNAMQRAKIEAQASIAERMQDRSFLQAVLATKGQRVFSGEIVKQEMPAARSIEAKQAELGIETSAKAAIESMRKAAIDRIEGGPPGKPDVGAATSRAINELDNLSKVTTAAFADSVKKMHDNISEANRDSLPKFNKLMSEMASPTGALQKIVDIGNNIKETVKNAELPVGKKRQSGTLKMTGSLFEKFDPEGELVELHGEESIVPKGDVSAFIKEYANTSSANIEQTLKSLGVQGFNPTANAEAKKDEENKKESARIAYLKTLATKAVVDGSGNVKHAYSPETVDYAERMLKELGVESPTEQFKKALGEQPKSVDPLAKLTGLNATLRDWQSNISAMSKPESKEAAPPTAPAPSETSPPTTEPPAPTTEQQAAIPELKDHIVQLNTTLRELISHTDAGVDKQVKAIKSLSGNRLG